MTFLLTYRFANAREKEAVRIQLTYRDTEELRSAFQSVAMGGSGPELFYDTSEQAIVSVTMRGQPNAEYEAIFNGGTVNVKDGVMSCGRIAPYWGRVLSRRVN